MLHRQGFVDQAKVAQPYCNQTTRGSVHVNHGRLANILKMKNSSTFVVQLHSIFQNTAKSSIFFAS
jgi:hypothetical protein